MSWSDEANHEIAEMFGGYTNRTDDVTDALERWRAYRSARVKEQLASPKRREYMRAYHRAYYQRPDVRKNERRRQRSPEYLARRRAYMAEYLRDNAEQRKAATERARRWRESRRAIERAA